MKIVDCFCGKLDEFVLNKISTLVFLKKMRVDKYQYCSV
jgi:hypothetical protein